MKDHFDRLRDISVKFDSKDLEYSSCFESALFPLPPWELETAEEVLPISTGAERSEKEKTIVSLEKFVEKETKNIPVGEEKKVTFAGGEVAISTTACEIVHQLQGSAPDLVSNKLLAVFLGDLIPSDENDEKVNQINGTLSRMISAMNLSDGEFERKSSLRYAIDEDDEVKSKEVIDQFFTYIYSHQIKVVLTFGGLDSRSLIGKRDRLARIHGKFIQKKISFSDGTSYLFNIVPIFHPAYLRVNPKMKKTTWEDLQRVMRFLNKY